MAHAPDEPQLYVCANCYVVHAGIHGEDHNFKPPTNCGACDSQDFYLTTNYPKHPNE